jgi:predicted RNA-binding protein associated with RNAse of E/G family
VLAPGSPVHVRKLKPTRALDYAWDGFVLRCDADGIVLRAEFNVDLVERDFATFRRGDIFVEFYYWDRCYNVFQISTPQGRLKGWYANVGLPAELTDSAGELQYVDLALDVWARPDGGFVVLDQDEFDALLHEHADMAEAAERGRQALLEVVSSGRLPHWDCEAPGPA